MSKRLLYLLSFFILSAMTGLAQFDTAEVLGTVRDPSRSTIANATISLRNVNTGIVATGKTDGSGNYEFLTVKIGDYKVTADAVGFARASSETFNVAVNARQRVNLTMQVGAASDSITVSGAAAIV